jgi:thiamine biosynthesis lipoprotein
MIPNADNMISSGAVTRRRFISILAAAGAVSLLPRGLGATRPKTITWEGVALGAQAKLMLQHGDEAWAREAVAASVAEVARLEAIFSLHQADSALSRLNHAGRLDESPVELRELLAKAFALSRLSEGAFDPTIQPLWQLYAAHFSGSDPPPEGPAPDAIAEALRLVDWRKVEIDGSEIRLGRPGMALTLNGIAQGYITDRVGALLRERGFEHVLVNMGEGLALGPKWDGGCWTVGIADPRRPAAILTELPLTQGAVATSGGYGYQFDRAGRFTHILDPKTGQPARQWASVTVIADSAALADGLSTALSVVDSEIIRAVLGEKDRAYFVPFSEKGAFWL